MLKQWFGNALERERLEAAIRDANIALWQSGADTSNVGWGQAAKQHLANAQAYLDKDNLQQGWSSVKSANRQMLLDDKNPQAHVAATALLRETREKLTGWRANAIADLITESSGNLRPDLQKEPWRVVRAMEIRDGQSDTNYLKIMLRRRHLQRLVGILLAFILLTFLLGCYLPAPFDDASRIFAVLLFGAIGAALSVAVGLMKADLAAKVPAQQLGAFVIWVRPVIGATAALIAFLLLNSKAIRFFDWAPTDLTAVLTVATVAGFSERFIVGAIEKFGDGK